MLDMFFFCFYVAALWRKTPGVSTAPYRVSVIALAFV